MTDFGCCSPLNFANPPGNAQVTCRPHRANPTVAKHTDAILGQYHEASLTQNPTSIYSSALFVVPTKSGRARITCNPRKLNKPVV